MGEKLAYVYIVTNKPNGTLYIGVTTNLAQRIYQHKKGVVDGFSKRYGLSKLVYAETFPSITEAIQAEKQMKKWERFWKVKRIVERNPNWEDLYETLN